MQQLTKEQAIAFYNGGEWKDWTDEQIVRFQLYQDLVCLPFDRFHQAIEAVLNRPVWTHEFGKKDLIIAEYEGRRERPSMEEIIAQIPPEKLIVLKVDES